MGSELFTISGSFKNLMSFLVRMRDRKAFEALESYGEEGVAALRAHTPVDSGTTADSWSYEIVDDGTNFGIIWSNSNLNDGVNIAVIRQFGHATGTGGYVSGVDYINPALQPVFDSISKKVWKAVTSA